MGRDRFSDDLGVQEEYGERFKIQIYNLVYFCRVFRFEIALPLKEAQPPLTVFIPRSGMFDVGFEQRFRATSPSAIALWRSVR